MNKAVNIMSFLDENEAKRKQLLNKTCVTMKTLKSAGYSNNQIIEVLQKAELPTDIYMCVTGRFSEICKFGRLLTKKERDLFNS